MQQWHGRLPVGAQCRNERRWRDQRRLLSVRSPPPIRVARRRPADQLGTEDEPWLASAQHERSVGKLVQRRTVVKLPSRAQIDALVVELFVDRVCADLTGVELAPDRAEAHVVLATTERARPMTGSERGRLVEEEELREAAGLEEWTTEPAAELEPAGDPPPAVEAPPNASTLVMEAPSVAIDQSARGIRDQLAEWCDPILQRHSESTSLEQVDVRALDGGR